ncbi:MAG: hypothetical protein WC534_03395 [Candidatus Paceibacterota bacterium]
MDKKLPFVLALAIVLACFAIIAGCTNPSTGLPPSENPKDYFPMAPGNQWDYKIQIYENTPLFYQETSWPMGSEKSIGYSRRGIYYKAEPGETYELSLKVKGSAPKQGPFQIAKGVELEVLKDSLHIFDDDVTGIFWAPFEDRFLVNQVVTYSPNSISAPHNPWGGWGQEDGHSLRIIFFAEKPGVAISTGTNTDSTLFDSVDYNVPGYQGAPCLHFIREVKADENPSELGKFFTEDMWYANGKGLIRLEQKIEGKTSMVWTLEKFTPNS